MAVFSEQLREDRAQVLAVVVLDAPAVHLAGVDDKRGHEVHRPVPDVLELLVFDLAVAHRAGRTPAFERLEVRLLVEAEHNFTARSQIRGPFVAPQDA